jgi:hypothetical protein
VSIFCVFFLCSPEAWTYYNVSLLSHSISYSSYFIADVYEWDTRISRLENILKRSLRSHPRRQKTLALLGRSLFQRRKLMSRSDDVDQSILHLIEAILLLLRVPGEFGVNLIEIFSELAFDLIQRSKRSNGFEDANFAIQCFRCLQSQPIDSSCALRNEVTTSIIEALGIRAASGSSDGMQDINDVITTYDRLLNLDYSESPSFRAPRALLLVISVCGYGKSPVLDQCIRHLREECILRSRTS